MGKHKKNKRGLLDKRVNPNTETTHLIDLLIHGDEDQDVVERKREKLLDSDVVVDPVRMAEVVESRVMRGETTEDIAYYSYPVLRNLLTHLQIQGRSTMTTKMEMSKALVKHFKKKNKKGKKKK